MVHIVKLEWVQAIIIDFFYDGVKDQIRLRWNAVFSLKAQSLIA